MFSMRFALLGNLQDFHITTLVLDYDYDEIDSNHSIPL